MKKLILLLIFLPILSGCFLYDCGYTRNDDTAIYKTDAANKMPISYSLHFVAKNEQFGAPTENSLRRKIDETLKQTGLFSEVTYDTNSNENYHIEFRYQNYTSGLSVNSPFYNIAPLWKSLCICTLFVLPEYGGGISGDLSAILYLKGRPIWTVAHAEKCGNCVGWICLPVGLVLNYWSVWHSIEENLVRSTVNDLTKEHIRRYLDPTTVELTNPEDVGEK